jgi:DNA repair protein RadC
LTATGDLLGIPVLDHIVVGDGRYFSFKEGGHMQPVEITS